MKQIFTLAIKGLIVVCFLIGMRVKAWAIETASAAEDSDGASSFFSQPWIWIALIVTIVIILIGPFNDDREFKVIRKKRKAKKIPVQQ